MSGVPVPPRRREDDAGQVAPLLALVVLVALLGLLLLVRTATVAHDRARARAAADAAALAGAAEGPRAAEATVVHNGARTVRYVALDGVVEVTVRVGEAEATARAARTVVTRGP